MTAFPERKVFPRRPSPGRNQRDGIETPGFLFALDGAPALQRQMARCEALLRRASLEHGQATLVASGSTGGTLSRWFGVTLSPIGGRVYQVRSPLGRRCQALRIDGYKRANPDSSGKRVRGTSVLIKTRRVSISRSQSVADSDRSAVAAELAKADVPVRELVRSERGK